MSTTKSSSLALHLGGVGAVAIITGIAYMAGVRPLMAARVQAWQFDRELNEKRSVVEDLRTELASTRSDLSTVRRSLETGDIRLVGSSLVNSQIAKLGIAAESANVMLTETSPGQPEEGALLVRVPIRISGKGHYPDFAKFLEGLDHDLSDTVVLGFDISGRADVPDEPATFSVDLLWYALREGAESGARAGGQTPVAKTPG